MSTAMSGMMAQERRATATAQNVANAMTPGYDRLETTMTSTDGGVEAIVAPSRGVPASADGTEELKGGTNNVNLTEEAMDLIQSEIAYKANAAVFETGADMWDLLASVNRDD